MTVFVYRWYFSCKTVIGKARKPTESENDACSRSQNLTSVSYDADLWPPFIVSSRCPLDHLCRFVAKSVHASSKYRVHTRPVGNGRTNGRTDRSRTLCLLPFYAYVGMMHTGKCFTINGMSLWKTPVTLWWFTFRLHVWHHEMVILQSYDR